MSEPTWLLRSTILAVHDSLLSRFGGSPGVRDEGRLGAALARPRQAYGYGVIDLHDLAAAYANGIVIGRPFVEGHKRTGFVAAAVFLELNGCSVNATEQEVVLKTLALAAGELTEHGYAEWLRNLH